MTILDSTIFYVFAFTLFLFPQGPAVAGVEAELRRLEAVVEDGLPPVGDELAAAEAVVAVGSGATTTGEVPSVAEAVPLAASVDPEAVAAVPSAAEADSEATMTTIGADCSEAAAAEAEVVGTPLPGRRRMDAVADASLSAAPIGHRRGRAAVAWTWAAYSIGGWADDVEEDDRMENENRGGGGT